MAVSKIYDSDFPVDIILFEIFIELFGQYVDKAYRLYRMRSVFLVVLVIDRRVAPARSVFLRKRKLI